MADNEPDLVVLTAEVAAAYFDNNTIEPDKIGSVIAAIHTALKAISDGVTEEPVEEETPKLSRAEIRKSINPDYLVSFVDGRHFKTLKRHLAIHGMTPTDYRERYGLPSDYPMVAPNYSAARSSLAVAAGLGQGGRKPTAKTGRKARA